LRTTSCSPRPTPTPSAPAKMVSWVNSSPSVESPTRIPAAMIV
jgi:hypothetical protein